MTDKPLTANDLPSKKHHLWSWVTLLSVLSISDCLGTVNLPTAEALTQRLGISQQDLANLNKGDIVF